ncbi:MAG: type 4a pilus biogenesis protein PilO [Nitrospirae bacterium]|nr:type 4a pilus biogenesis protein PilO [Nitrospirota bacterium]
MKNIKLNKREKYLLIIAIFVAIGILINLGVKWYQGQAGSLDVQIESRKEFLQKQTEKLSDKDIRIRIEDANTLLNILNGRLLHGNNPHIAVANLQKLLFETAGSTSIKIDTTSIKKTEDLEIYLKIPLEITLTTSIDKLTALLLKIESSKTLLSISDIKLNTDEKNSSKFIQVTMTVSGYIRKETT